jgi:cellulose biosynthesis protein BcsQ
MITLVVNTKGGSGKTTVSQQVIAPYIYDRNLLLKGIEEKVPLYEIDNCNESSRLEDTAVFDITKLKVFEGKMQLGDIVEQSYEDSKRVVVDSGGSEETLQTIAAFQEAGVTFMVDFVIPVSLEEDTMNNVLQTYEKIREMSKKSKILFVLNKAVNRDDEEAVDAKRYRNARYFLGEDYDPKKKTVGGLFAKIVKNETELGIKEKVQFMFLDETRIIGVAAEQKMTAYEMGQDESDLEEMVSERYSKLKTKEERAKLLKFSTAIAQSQAYAKYLRREVFKNLDDFYGVSEDEILKATFDN